MLTCPACAYQTSGPRVRLDRLWQYTRQQPRVGAICSCPSSYHLPHTFVSFQRWRVRRLKRLIFSDVKKSLLTRGEYAWKPCVWHINWNDKWCVVRHAHGYDIIHALSLSLKCCITAHSPVLALGWTQHKHDGSRMTVTLDRSRLNRWFHNVALLYRTKVPLDTSTQAGFSY